jgi:methyltransferase family protein
MPFERLKQFFRKAEPTRPNTVAANLDADDAAWMTPPRDLHDASAWDVYWRNHLVKGAMDIKLMEALSNSDEIIEAMHENGLRSVLFVGNGLAIEPRRYIEAGFDVTIMDLSAFAMDTIRKALTENNLRGECVSGDLLDPSVCPGAFDVVIERRTLQLFSDAARDDALVAVTNRLSPRGLFVTHAHLGAWRPDRPRTHPAEKWLRRAGWQTWRRALVLDRRTAMMRVTTG